MLARVEALEAIPRVQIQRVQQYMSVLILEFRLFVWKEIRPTKEFTQKVRDDVGGRVVSNVVSLSQVQLTDRQKKMVNLIKDNPFISAQEMSVVLSVVHRTIQRDLATMQKLGVLIREGNTSAGHWVIIQK